MSSRARFQRYLPISIAGARNPIAIQAASNFQHEFSCMRLIARQGIIELDATRPGADHRSGLDRKLIFDDAVLIETQPVTAGELEKDGGVAEW